MSTPVENKGYTVLHDSLVNRGTAFTEAQRKAAEEQAKQQAEFQQKELEAQQKLAVLLLENKIKNNE